jgi:plasmid stabilization system protein ParE
MRLLGIRAENRLAELGLYIAGEAGAKIANDYLDRIYAGCMALAELPERGRSRDDILPACVRSPWSGA